MSCNVQDNCLYSDHLTKYLDQLRQAVLPSKDSTFCPCINSYIFVSLLNCRLLLVPSHFDKRFSNN